ncbi:MAG: hypothetical protein V4596_00455 [Bdellovibrionota bacterium]
MKTILGTIALVLAAGTAKAERIVCDAQDQFGSKVQVVVEDKKVTVKSGSNPEMAYNNVDHV